MSKEFKEEKEKQEKKNGYGLKDIMQERKDLDKQLARLKAVCNHKNNEGTKIKVEPVGPGSTVVVCTKCLAEFDISTIDAEKLAEAVEIVHNALNQVKVLTSSKKQRDINLCRAYGEADCTITNLPSVYNKIVAEYANKGKKKSKNNRGNEHGYYGRRTSFL